MNPLDPFGIATTWLRIAAVFDEFVGIKCPVLNLSKSYRAEWHKQRTKRKARRR